MFLSLLISLILHSDSGSSPTEDRQAATGSLYVCPGSGYSTQMALADYPPANSGATLLLAVNTQLSSAQRGKLGLKLDACCPGNRVYEVPSTGWTASRAQGKGPVIYNVTITQVMCN